MDSNEAMKNRLGAIQELVAKAMVQTAMFTSASLDRPNELAVTDAVTKINNELGDMYGRLIELGDQLD